ncbi:hypothetical protein GO730_00290 [Spirosoma sp. HMF3257]|uniref:Helix-turn-helix domain-containing protein n=1 Tax=Spirosoma telluris TaxID=2183553 RepID=A0A327NET4_9BACT|nr:hypothetical protein [Spirosoma telluris]RAI73243.1 hypothetical protein HMF3257_00285 [Spirosoma telluris]
MLIVDEKLGHHITDLLDQCEEAIRLSAERDAQREKEFDRCLLMNETEVMEYLKRDGDTLRYYQKHGLRFYKMGRNVWYTKGDIDDWLKKGLVKRRID